MQQSMIAPYPIANTWTPEAVCTIVQADVVEGLATLPPESVDLVVSSPPYNIGKAYEQRVGLEEYLRWQREVIGALDRVVRPGGAICWQVGSYVENGAVFPLDIMGSSIFWDLGYTLRNRIVWHFGHGLHTQRRFSGRHEVLLWWTKGEDYTFNLDSVRVPAKYPGKRAYRGPRRGEIVGNPAGVNPTDMWMFLQAEWESGVWEIPNVKHAHPEKSAHPCQFPVELAERCVLACSNPGDLVLDPFVGSGQTLIAAIKQQRRAIGIDRDATYCHLAAQRVEHFNQGLLRPRSIGTPIAVPLVVAALPEGMRV